MQIVLLKTFVAMTWAVALAPLLAPASSPLAAWAGTGKLLVAGLALVHAIECIFFLPLLRRLDAPLPGQLLQTFVFGVSHFARVRAELDRQAAGASHPTPEGSED